MIDHDKARGIDARIGFRFGESGYVAHLHDGEITIERGLADGCDVVFTAAPTALAAVVYGGAPLDSIGVEGDIGLAKRFTTLFPLPPKVA
jgi:hypothetical protein